MKKLLAILFASSLIYSCGNDENKNKPTETKPADTAATAPAQPPPPPAGGATAASEKGLELIGSNDCMTCHALDHKVIGPAYKDVAKKYEDNKTVEDTLISKIKRGGMGNWGNIPMTPHPDLSEADAREMVKYILSLKNK
jgi:cytochrome c